LAKFTPDERGANPVEYILLAALVDLAVIAAVVFLRDDAGTKINGSGS
jgi:Flp pilus assembly pilin Flp